MKPLAATIAVVLLSACTVTSKPSRTVETPPPSVILMGGDYGSVSFACHGGVGVYVTKEDSKATSAVAVLADDPNCGES